MKGAVSVPTSTLDYLKLKVRKNLSKGGLMGTIKVAARKLTDELRKVASLEGRLDRLDKEFDRRHGVKTNYVLDFDDLGVEHAEFGTRHQPTPAAVLQPIVSSLPIKHEDFVFVDLGCGMGRAAFLAAEFPFKKIIGVEYSAELHKIADQNRIAFRNEKQRCTNIEFVCADAAQHPFPDENTVLYLFNPFGKPVLRRVVDNLAHSLEKHPRKIFIVYYNPVDADVLDQAPFLEKFLSSAARPGVHAYAIYRN
jgi:SAM-dependent methyltransferase